ncbi:MAG: hypothetical protein ABJB01_05820 [Rudaea sp.]
MRTRATLLIVVSLLIAACGNARDEHAGKACSDEIAKRLAGRNFQLDAADIARHIKPESADTVLITSTVVLDKGMSSENRQTFDCRARLDASGAASVLYLQFNWNTSDLKPAR